MGVRSWFAASMVSVIGFVVSQERERDVVASPGPAGPAPIAQETQDALPVSDLAPPEEAPWLALHFVASESECPDDMVLVEGLYCPLPRQICKRWMDSWASGYGDFRCAEYVEPSVCTSPSREKKRFCIDREEYVAPGESLPLAHQSWTSAGKVCEARGARLCLESEWQFACEGEEMRPYPYGFKRDASLCNIDRMNLGKVGRLNDLRAPITEYPQCLSPFGVHNMSGNIEEWATLDHGWAPNRSTMKGAWWLPGKNTCRAATLGHGETYEGAQVGVRCCKDASGS